MIVHKEEVGVDIWICQLSTGETVKVICREGQTPEEVLAEAEPE